MATPRRKSPKLLFLAVVVMLCYAAVWLGGKTWAYLWQRRHHQREFVPASRYSGLGAGGSRGETLVYVMNCASNSTVEADAYNAMDSVEMVAASWKSVSTGESGALHCAGEGKRYCKMTVSFIGSPEQCHGTSPSPRELNLDWGRWAIVKGFEITTHCYPIIDQLDSAASCDRVMR